MHITVIRFVSSIAALLVGAEALACTTAIVSAGASKTGRPMIWKQRDASDPYNHIAHVRGGTYAFTALFATSDSLCRRAYAGVNDAGFAISNNLSYNLESDASGTRNGELMTAALANCASVAEFAGLLESWPVPRHLSANFAVIDAAGGAAYFEVSDSAVVRFDVPEGGYLFRTNFSVAGEQGKGRGQARYATMERIMASQARKGFDAEFLMNAGRSFVNVLTGGDALRGRRGGVLYEHDFIPRSTTTASIVIEGVAPGDRPDGGMMWCAPGYTPTSYAIPVWVAAGGRVPSVLCGDAPANLLSVRLKKVLSPFAWDEKYISVRPLRRILCRVRKAERTELRLSRRLCKDFRKNGIDIAAINKYNEDADKRFNNFSLSISPLLKE